MSEKKPFIFHFIGVVVKDGDTVECSALDFGFGFGKLSPTAVRIAGIDAPESASHGENKVSQREKACGLKVKQVVARWFIENPGAALLSYSWDGVNDKYGGRILGDFAPMGGERLSEFLLSKKLVRVYGGEQKTPWSDEQLAAIEAYA